MKLDANESPYDLPDDIRAEIAEAFAKIALNRYPDTSAVALRTALAERLGVSPDWIAVGNGSDELIGYLIQMFGRPDAVVIAPEPTFSMYRILAQAAGVPYRGIPLGARYELDGDALRRATHDRGAHLLFFSYPNNPTGNCWDEQIIAGFLDDPNALVIADEAYFEFSGRTFLPMLNDRPNLLILRTFSKAYRLAGLRVGYLVARPEWIECVHKVRLPYNVNAFSQTVAAILMKHAARIEASVRQILGERERVFRALATSDRFEPFRTDANFILFRAREGAPAVFRALVRAGVLVRNLHRPGALENCLRVTIGTPEENDAFLGALDLR